MGRTQNKGITIITNQVDAICGNCKRKFLNSSTTQMRLHYKLCKPHSKKQTSIHRTILDNNSDITSTSRITRGVRFYNNQ